MAVTDYLLDAEDEDLRAFTWGRGRNGYITRKVWVNGRCVAVFLHLVVLQRATGPLDGLEGDHRNRNLSDNRRANLRRATRSQNCANRRGWSKVSPFKGVGFDGRYGPHAWFAYIRVDKRRKSLGYFLSPEEAARAYDAAATQCFGEYARLNFP